MGQAADNSPKAIKMLRAPKDGDTLEYSSEHDAFVPRPRWGEIFYDIVKDFVEGAESAPQERPAFTVPAGYYLKNCLVEMLEGANEIGEGDRVALYLACGSPSHVLIDSVSISGVTGFLNVTQATMEAGPGRVNEAERVYTVIVNPGIDNAHDMDAITQGKFKIKYELDVIP